MSRQASSLKPRFFVALPLASGLLLELPAGPARHVQVLRLQPGDAVLLFNGDGLEWSAQVLQMGRQQVQVQVRTAQAVDRELALSVTLALAVPANERMDMLVEKASELGVARIQPLISTRSVLRLSGDRAERRQAHWHAVAAAACEQCGRSRVPQVLPMLPLAAWLQAQQPASRRWLLSLRVDAKPVAAQPMMLSELCVLSGPEGGLTEAEEEAALAQGFLPVSLGPRTLRADTAPLSVLAWLGLQTQVSD